MGSSTWRPANPRRQEMTEAVLDMIVDNMLPLSMVESSSFRKLFGIAQPSYTLPSGKHLSQTLLPNRVGDIMRSINDKLSGATDITLAIDPWSSQDMRSYIGVTAHFIKDYKLQSVMLSCQCFRGSHTADSIYATYERIMTTYGLHGKVAVIVTDNASNMVKAFTLPGMDINVTVMTMMGPWTT